MVLHLGANSQPSATWDQLLPSNIVGVRNVFAAAADARCRRVVFASSVHVVMGYPDNDLARLVQASIEARPTVRFAIVNGISDNARKRLAAGESLADRASRFTCSCMTTSSPMPRAS